MKSAVLAASVANRRVPERPRALATARALATDGELGKALIEQHPDAPRAAWGRYSPLVRGIVKRGLGPGADVEDVVNDVFLCLIQRAPALRDSEALRPFVIGITRHTLHREIRRRKRRRQLAGQIQLGSDAPSVGGGPTSAYVVMKMHELLLRLTEQERMAMVLRFVEGMTMSEVAVALRTSEPTAKRRISRAQERFTKWVHQDPILEGYLAGTQRWFGRSEQALM